MTQGTGAAPPPVIEAPADADAAYALPRRTTPTWEVELLISGVAVFAMLQLPGLLDDAILALRPRFSLAWGVPLVTLYLYAKSAALILAATFVLHLLLRARWIALVGLVSIHPHGVDWRRLRAGPIAQEIEQARLGRMDDVIERADNLATTVFALGVTLGSLLLWLCLFAAGLMLVSVLRGTPPDAWLVSVVVTLLVLPFALAQWADRRLGARLAPGSRVHTVVRGVLAGYGRLGFGMARNPAMAILSSNNGRHRMAALTTVIMLLAAVAVAGGYQVLRAPGSLGSFALFPRAAPGAPGAVLAGHYDDQRDPLRDRVLPYVQSAVASGPYLRLTVPYQPQRDEPAMLRRCPALAGLRGDARDALARECLARLYALTLDGRPIAPGYEVGSDARTDRPALVAMIELRGLAPGRHELQVAMMPATSGREARDASAPTAYRIPFWR